jgi:aldehyde dehydrogenase (NAD+)
MAQSTAEEHERYSPDGDWNQLYLDGPTPVEDREEIAVENPATGEAFATVPAGTTDDIDRAYEVASEAQREWTDASPQDRIDVIQGALRTMEERREEILQLLAVESGSARVKAEAELQNAMGITQESASFPTRMAGDHRDSNVPGKENLVKREPAGVVAVISPWNFPLHLSMRAVAPALATGNAVLLKPASTTPITGGLLLARLFEDAGLPEGLLTVVTGHGSDVGDRVAGHETADVVSFTGSSAVGSTVASEAAGNFAQPAMELGGNGPHVVLEDADVEDAVDAGTFGTFLHQGQICISINRHLVHESIYDEYVERLTERAESLPIGNPAEDEEAVIGPIIDESQVDDITTYIDQTVEQGATLETGGDHDGRFVEPTVLSDASNEMSAACNEHFGPVAPVIPFADDEEAVEIANDTEYGLAASVFGGDRSRAEDVADGIDAGMVHINDQPVNDEPHVPFGGMKASGIGRYNGEHVLREFTETKWVSVQREHREYPF